MRLRPLAVVLLLSSPARLGADRGPCAEGYEHAFDGYLSCALDATPCARKVITGSDVRPVLMRECAEACNGCVGLSLWAARECWVYDEWLGEQRVDEQSVICRRMEPPPPLLPPHPPPPPSMPPPPEAAPVAAAAAAAAASAMSVPRQSLP